eukprot:CAMPEP_0114697326 /NCGR_PEP_ID=MMETSP0191-20121206/73670_1 /TAXON_ID=126664 /ORGANISM="Sorites sp." /LENGTH=435 /DNA_ID=CAMNT_0001996305 /DNA_START=110 /DNA_END=1417 /DNA_ORIENTATION=+
MALSDHETSLLRQVEHWHQLFMDTEASFAQTRADEALLRKQLSSALERERILAAKNLELRCKAQGEEKMEKENKETKEAMTAMKKANEASVAALCEQLGSARMMLQCKDEELDRVKSELRTKLLTEHRTLELELGDVRKRLEGALKKLSAKEHLCEVMDQELQLLRGQLPLKEAELEKMRKKGNELEQEKKTMQWELSDLQTRLEVSIKKAVAKEEEMQQLQGHINAKEEQLQKLQASLERSPKVEALEMELAELNSKLELALKQIVAKDQLFELKEQEVELLKADFKKEHELCHAAVSDNCELRQIYGEKLNALGEQEARHQRSVKLLEAEREMWLSRSDHLEKINTRLRLDLNTLEAELTPKTERLVPTPPPRPSTAKASREIRDARSSPTPRELRLNYPRAGRTLLQHRSGATDRYDDNGKLRSFDAEGNEI